MTYKQKKGYHKITQKVSDTFHTNGFESGKMGLLNIQSLMPKIASLI
jgi:hypothetical protein